MFKCKCCQNKIKTQARTSPTYKERTQLMWYFMRTICKMAHKKSSPWILPGSNNAALELFVFFNIQVRRKKKARSQHEGLRLTSLMIWDNLHSCLTAKRFRVDNVSHPVTFWFLTCFVLFFALEPPSPALQPLHWPTSSGYQVKLFTWCDQISPSAEQNSHLLTKYSIKILYNEKS